MSFASRLSNAARKLTARLFLRGHFGVGALAGDLTYSRLYAQYGAVDPGGATRAITLHAAEDGDHMFVRNTADGQEDLTIKNPAGTVLTTVPPNGHALVACESGTWFVLFEGGPGQKVKSLYAVGTALTNSTTETVLASYTIPASRLKAGTVVRVRGVIRVTANNGATTLTPRLRLGATTLTGTALITGSAVDTSVDHVFPFMFEFVTLAAAGAAVATVGHGQFAQLAAAGGALVSAALASTNFATNGALLLELTGQWSAADANSCRAEVFNVTIEG